MKTEASEGETEIILSSSISRDFLLRFSGEFSPRSPAAAEPNGSDSDEIELGLSLGGCFKSSSSHKNRILRSSSIPSIEVPPLFPLFRTCSLPDEEMESKKRKRRFEVSSPAALTWIAGDGPPPASEQSSGVSVGSNSSVGSELENRSGQGFELSGFTHAFETRSRSRFPTMSEQKNHKSSSFSPFSPFSPTPISKPINGIVSKGTLLRKNNGGRCINGSGELSKSMMKEMPVVSTKGDGPNGRRIEGFLYKYGRGEEVRIVCVCHGSFLTPAEFVKHAGGGYVAHPLQHIIVVNPSPLAFL